jgi:nucleoside-diphosphate-sugar epimerase
MKLLVFGLGYTASRFVALHGSRFATVTGSVRSDAKAARLARPGLTMRVLSPETVDPALPDDIAEADAILVSIPPGSEGDPVLARFAAAIAAAPRLRWIGYLSTIGVYGDQGGAWIDETAPVNPTSLRTEQRVAAENGWLDLGRASGKSVQIFRLAGIYGPGRSPLQKVLDGTARRLVKPGQVFNRIQVDDIAAVLAASLERPQPGAIYNVTDDEPAPPQEVVTFAADLAGVEPPPEEPFVAATLTPMARSFYGENKRVRSRRLRTELGVTLAFPTYREGLRALASELDRI